MGSGFVKLYDEHEQDGYISAKNIYCFNIIREEDDFGDVFYVIKAFMENEDPTEGFVVSYPMESVEQAYDFLDDIIKNLK